MAKSENGAVIFFLGGCLVIAMGIIFYLTFVLLVPDLVSSETNGQSEASNSDGDDSDGGRKDFPPPQIVVADEEIIKADEIDELNRQAANVITGTNRDAARGDATADDWENAKVILNSLTDAEKNLMWWEIAQASYRTGDVAYRYTLTSEAATPIARKYGMSVRSIIRFFREGVQASWRGADPFEKVGQDERQTIS